MDVLLPGGILAGLLLFNIVRSLPWSLRLSAAGCLGVLGAVPVIVMFGTDQAANQVLQQEIMPMLQSMGLGVDAGRLISQVRRIVLSTIGLAMTTSIAANWWIGKQFSFRSRLRLRAAVVDDRLIWMVIGGLSLIVLGWAGSGGEGVVYRIAPFLGWNAAGVGAFIFGVQGVGIIEHLLERRGASRRSTRWILMLLALALFLPGVNIVVLVGLPGLGISEIWLDYKRRGINEGHTES
jgi:hypothetical protein